MSTLMAAFEELREEGNARLDKDGIAREHRSFEYSLDMRYVGQHWDIQVPASMGNGQPPKLEEIIRDFHRRHEMVNGYKLEDREVEIASLRLMAIGRSPRLELKKVESETRDASSAVKAKRTAYFGTERGFIETAVYDGTKLRAGDQFEGPAIVEKPNTTIVVYPGQRAHVDGYENMIIDIG